MRKEERNERYKKRAKRERRERRQGTGLGRLVRCSKSNSCLFDIMQGHTARLSCLLCSLIATCQHCDSPGLILSVTVLWSMNCSCPRDAAVPVAVGTLFRLGGEPQSPHFLRFSSWLLRAVGTVIPTLTVWGGQILTVPQF